MNWRERVDKAIRIHLEGQVAESVKNREAYEAAPDSGNAQLWVSVANLSKEIFDLNLRIKSLEKTLSERTHEKKSSKKQSLKTQSKTISEIENKQ